MKTVVNAICGTCVGIVVFVTAATARPMHVGQGASPQDVVSSTGDLPPAEQALADQAAETAIQAVCLTCHPLANVVRVRRTAGDWNVAITRMVGNGARGTEDEFRTIQRYFIRYYGTVHVNSASAVEFSAVLGYSQKEAAAIVAYRAAHGPFRDLASLSQVPGIDRAKSRDQPEALRFD